MHQTFFLFQMNPYNDFQFVCFCLRGCLRGFLFVFVFVCLLFVCLFVCLFVYLFLLSRSFRHCMIQSVTQIVFESPPPPDLPREKKKSSIFPYTRAKFKKEETIIWLVTLWIENHIIFTHADRCTLFAYCETGERETISSAPVCHQRVEKTETCWWPLVFLAKRCWKENFTPHQLSRLFL